jgi:hypothetical protein
MTSLVDLSVASRLRGRTDTMCGHRVIAVGSQDPHSAAVRAVSLGGSYMEVPDDPICRFGRFAKVDVDLCGR